MITYLDIDSSFLTSLQTNESRILFLKIIYFFEIYYKTILISYYNYILHIKNLQQTIASE